MAASCGYAAMFGDPAIMQHISMLSAALESIEGRSETLTQQLSDSQNELASCKSRYALCCCLIFLLQLLAAAAITPSVHGTCCAGHVRGYLQAEIRVIYLFLRGIILFSRRRNLLSTA